MRGRTVSALAGAFAIAVVSGCSPVTGVNGDDDDDTSAPDASGPDAAWEAGTVVVEVRSRGGGPAAGVRVIFNNRDGSVASTQNTNDAGRASFDLFPHSSVTVATTEGFDASFIQHRINTVLGVMPGDHIVVGGRNGDFDGREMGVLQVNIVPVLADTTTYELRIGCDQLVFDASSPNIDWTLFENECNRGVQPVDVLATATDSLGDRTFQTLLGVELDAAVSTPITEWSKEWDNFTVSLDNPPAGMQFAQAELAVWRRGLDYSLGEPPGVDLSGGAGSNIGILFPQNFAERLAPQVLAAWGSAPDDIDGFSTYQRQSSASASDLALDLSNDLLPRVTSASFEQNGLDDTRMHYDVDGDVSGATAGAGSIQWSQTIQGGGTADVQVDWEWFFMMPPDTPSPIELPNVPPGSLEGGAWPPPAEADIVTTVVGFIDASFVGEWDDVRQNNGFELLDEPITADAPLGAEARLSIGGLIGFFN